MPKQDWNINTKEAYEGEQYGLATTNSQRLTYIAEKEMTRYGLGVSRGTKFNTIVPGNNYSGSIIGITMRELKLEAGKRPSDGTFNIPVGQPLGVMLEGPIMVKLVAAITGDKLGINNDGEFGSPNAGGFQEVSNVKSLKYPAAAGELIPVMVMQAGPGAVGGDSLKK